MATGLLRDPFDPTELSRGQQVAAVCQGIVVHVRGSFAPCWTALAAAIDVLRAEVGPKLTTYRIWTDLEWASLASDGWKRIGDEMARGAGRRPFWRCELADRAVLPEHAVDFLDVHATTVGEQQPRTSFLRVRLPRKTRPQVLAELVAKLADLLPFHVGSAGLMFQVVEEDRELAYDQVWAWARRYWGVEVVDPVASTWDAAVGLPGVNWITLLGNSLLEEKLPGLARAPLPSDVRVLRRQHGVMLQAGPTPRLGDINAFEDMAPYTSVAHLCADALVEDPTELRGMFVDQESTRTWTRRFLEPEEWMEST